MDLIQNKNTKIAVSIIIVIILLILLSNGIMKLVVRDPQWLVDKNRVVNEEKILIPDWQIYKNEEYRFSFQAPPMTKVVDCTKTDCLLSVVFGTEIFNEIVGLKEVDGPPGKYFMGVMVKTSPLETSLKEYVEYQKTAIRNVSLSNRQALGKGLNIDWIVKTIEIGNTQGYVIETIHDDENTPSRHFFIPLKNNQLLIIYENGKNIDNVLSKFEFH